MQNNYSALINRRFYIGFILSIIFLLSFILSINIGSYKTSFNDFLNLFLSIDNNAILSNILLHIRLPRTICAILSGTALSISGAIMQNLLKNPLASPYTLGVSHGSVFGAALAIILIDNTTFLLNYQYIIIIFAFAGSLATIIVILMITTIKNITAGAVILAGVALNSLFASGIMLLQYFGTEEEIASIVFWAFGDLGKPGWNEIFILLVIIVPVTVYFIINALKYNATIWDDHTVLSLGINIKYIRVIGLILTCFITASVVSFMGIIGFIGLIAPHIIRMIIGNDHRFLIPYSAILGSILVLCSDILGRTILSPIVIPVGIITSFMGAPIFLYILIKNKGIV